MSWDPVLGFWWVWNEEREEREGCTYFALHYQPNGKGDIGAVCGREV